MRLKKLGFLVVQISWFLKEIFNITRGGHARFAPRIVECGWPGEKLQRFLLIGEIDVPEEEIFTRSCDGLFRINSCPQRELFRKLSEGESLLEDPYYKWSLQNDDEVAFRSWLNAKHKLFNGFDVTDQSFRPIVVKSSKGVYLLQDGAHRLALQSLRGQTVFTVAISVWAFGFA